MSLIYPEQWEVARRVFKMYQSTSTQWQIVIAQTQSGKTGIARGVCNYFRGGEEDLNIYYICGMNDKSLKNQQIREFKGLIPEDQILFQKDLERKIKNKTIYPKTAYLFILDESHYAQNSMSLVHRFFYELIKLRMDSGTRMVDNESKVYFLSISATPMSEIAQLLDPNQECLKKIMIYQPPKEYYGFKKMREQGCLKPAFDLNEKTQRYSLVDIIKAHYNEEKKNERYKYLIIRFVNTAKGIKNRQDILKHLGAELSHDFDYINYHSKDVTLTNFNQQIKNPPDKLTIIGIYNSLRAGYQLDTKHVAMVHENISADVDVTVQGLPGRCCGYKNKDKHRVQVYCNTRAIDQYLKMVKNDFDPQTIPKKCKNIKQAGAESLRDNNKNTDLIQNKYENQVPILIKVPTKLFNKCKKFNQENPARSAKTYKKFWDKFEKDFRTLIGSEFWDQSESARAGLMILDQRNKSSTKTNSWVKWWNPGYEASQNSKAFNGFSNQNLNQIGNNKIKLKPGKEIKYIRYMYLNLKPKHPQYGYILLTSKRIMSNEEKNTVLTTGNEHFHPENNQSKIKVPTKKIELK